jgi:hypothetical protein
MAENITEPDDEPISLIGDDNPISFGSEEEPISLVEPEGGGSDFEPGGLKTFGVAAGEGHKEEYKRVPNNNGTGATRCRLFRSKIAAAPLEHMENLINEWLDGAEIEVKHVGHLVGTVEGKRPEPNLLVLVWY